MEEHPGSINPELAGRLSKYLRAIEMDLKAVEDRLSRERAQTTSHKDPHAIRDLQKLDHAQQRVQDLIRLFSALASTKVMVDRAQDSVVLEETKLLVTGREMLCGSSSGDLDLF